MIKPANYVSIEGWMVTELGLRGKDLMAYAIVYGFSQDGCGWFQGGRAYIADWLGCTAKTAGSVLARMTDAGLLVREESVTRDGKAFRYRTVGQWKKTSPPPGKKTPYPLGKNFPTPWEKTSPININGDFKQDCKERGRFKKPTVDELRAYAQEKRHASFDAERFFDYYESNGWKVGRNPMKDWKAAVRNWCRKKDGGKPQSDYAKRNLEAVCGEGGFIKDGIDTRDVGW